MAKATTGTCVESSHPAPVKALESRGRHGAIPPFSGVQLSPQPFQLPFQAWQACSGSP